MGRRGRIMKFNYANSDISFKKYFIFLEYQPYIILTLELMTTFVIKLLNDFMKVG